VFLCEPSHHNEQCSQHLVLLEFGKFGRILHGILGEILGCEREYR